MKRKATLTSQGDYHKVRITIEVEGDPDIATRRDTSATTDALIAGAVKIMCDAPMTGATYVHQIKIR